MHIIDYSEFEKKSLFFMNSPSMFYHIFVMFQFIFIILLIIWLNIFEMDDVVKVTALIRPSDNISTVYALPGGEVTFISYENNQLVHEGELLLQLDVKADAEELEISKKRIMQIEEDLISFEILLDVINSKIVDDIYTNEIQFNRAKNFLSENQRFQSVVENAKILYEREMSKPKSFIIQQNIDDLKRQFDQINLQYLTWKSTQEIQTRENIKQLTNEKNSIYRRMNDLERNIKNSNITAPITGRINEIRKMNIGDTIVTGEKLFEILPIENNSLKADVYLDPSYIAQISENQNIELTFTGLPTVRYGHITGKIKTIPPDCSMTNNGQLVFVLSASLDCYYLEDKNGKKIFLHSGMPAQGKIIVDKQKVMHMILKKLGFLY